MNSIRNSNYNPNNPTRFTVHGWNGDGTASVNWRVAERLFRLGDYNVSFKKMQQVKVKSVILSLTL
jgi:hypothetical protein